MNIPPTHTTAPAAARRIADIEVLRGIAILMVLEEHIPLNLIYWRSWLYDAGTAYWRGAAGVDLFFAVSGFVIARTLLPSLTAAIAHHRIRPALAAFWTRRFFRLLPAAWFWLALPLLACVTINQSHAFRGWNENWRAAIAAVLNLANVRLALRLDLRHMPLFTSYWSLSLEEQFYLLLPPLFLLLRRRLIWLALFALAYTFVIPNTLLAVLTRPGALAAGVILAMWFENPRYAALAPSFLRHAWPRRLCLAAAIIAAGAIVSGLTASWGTTGWGLLALISGALVFAASFNRGYIMQEGPARRAMTWIGARSYSLYLVHMPAYALARECTYRLWRPGMEHPPAEAALLIGFAVPFVLLASEFSYRVIERPLRRTGVRVAGRFEEVQ